MVPYAVVRANNLPLDTLDGLTGSAAVEAAAAALAHERAVLAGMRQAVCDRLHGLAAADGARYRRYIDLRRAIFNGKPLADIATRHAGLLAGDDLLRGWLDRANAVLRQEVALAALFDRELDAARSFSQTLATEPLFLQGMAMTRAQLYETARAYSATVDFGDKKKLNDEETIHRYLARAVTKVSPFSSFTSVGFAPLASAPGASLLNGRATAGRYSLDRAGFFKLYDRFVLRYRDHFRFRLTGNRSARADEQGQYQCGYLFTDQPKYYAHRTTFVTARVKSTALFIE